MSDLNRFNFERAPVAASNGGELEGVIGSASEEQHVPSDLTNMGAVNAALNTSEVTGQLLPGFFEVRPGDLRLFRKEGEL